MGSVQGERQEAVSDGDRYERAAYKCSCPSRKFPCKHALGLLLLWAAEGVSAVRTVADVGDGQAPDWAEEWLGGRRKRSEERKEKAKDEAAGPADPEAARRRAERRAARITGGARELEQRLTDLLRGGLAAVEQSGYGLWEETAARMVDAQAPGLAARVRELGSIPGSGAGWPVRLLEESALLHLLDLGWLGIDRLPAPLATTVRTRVGLPSPPTAHRSRTTGWSSRSTTRRTARSPRAGSGCTGGSRGVRHWCSVSARRAVRRNRPCRWAW